MSKLKNNVSTITSTDLFYENLADPSKLRPVNQTAKIVNNSDSEDEDSFMVDINNGTNKPSPKLNFNSEQRKDSEKPNLRESEIKKLLEEDKRMSLSDSDRKGSRDYSKESKESKESRDHSKESKEYKDEYKKKSYSSSDDKHETRSSDKKKSDTKKSDTKISNLGNYTSRLSSRNRSERSERSDKSNSSDSKINNLQKTMNNNLKINLDNFSSEDINNNSKPPLVKPIGSLNQSTFNQHNFNQPNLSQPNLHKPIGSFNQPNPSQPNFNQYNPSQPNFNQSNPSQSNPSQSIPNIATQKEIKFKKMETLAKLMHIKSLNIELTKHYTMDSDLEDMEAELKYHSDIQTKKNGVQLAKSFMCNAITGLEFMNERYDPFGFKLKGWADQVKMNKDDFDEVFGELLEKYKGEGKKMEPEMKLALMLVLSAGSFHMSQTIATGLPGLDDVIKNNPQLMAKIQSNINKSISGPTELEKKQELYNNIKKMHEQKVKSGLGSNTQPKTQPNQSNQSNQPKTQPNQPKTQGGILKPTNQPKSQPNQSNQPKSQPNQSNQTNQTNQRPTSATKQTKPTSVKNLLQNIKKSVPLDSIADSYSITVGDTIDTETDSSSQRPSVSQGVKTKSRLQGRNKIQFQNK